MRTSKLITIAPLTASFTRLWTSSIGIVAVQTAMGSRPTRKALRGGPWGGLAFGVNSIAFFYAIANASIATVAVISALQPALVMIGASRIFGEKVTRWGLGWTAVAIVGAAVAVLGKEAVVHTTTLGILCSVGSLVCMTVYFLASKQARQTLGAGEYVMGVMLRASVVVTPVAAIGGGLGHLHELDRFDWLWIMVMLIGPGVGGQLLMGWAVRFVPVGRTAMILLGSTVVSILAARPIHGEQPELIQLLGCAITLGALTLILQRRKPLSAVATIAGTVASELPEPGGVVMTVVDAGQAAGGLSRQEHEAAMAAYLAGGEARAEAAGNRGPVRFGPDGRLHADVVAAYWRQGFYVFTGVVGAEELAELRADAAEMIERAPVRKGAEVDTLGRPALGREFAVEPYLLIAPLSDPWGGTKALGGRHEEKMDEPVPDADAPEAVPYLIFGMCQAMPSGSGLRVYGHPHLLAIAAAINGPDFVPYNDAIFVKQPGLGGSVAWHQDGVTHWDNPNWDEGIHGFNFQVQLYETTAANALWVVPGTHKAGKVDIKAMVAANGGSTLLPDAIPLLCQPGDVTVVNRQTLHGSFANSSPNIRVSLTFGFHRRSSVLGVAGKLALKGDDVDWKPGPVYDERRVHDRSAVIQMAINARRQRFPHEQPFHYEPFAGREDEFVLNDETWARWIKDYNTRDLAI